MKKYFVAALIFMGAWRSEAQSPALFNYGNEQVSKAEFERVFMKNNQKDKKPDQKSIDEYLELYINFKLKVKEAREMGLDTFTSFVRELEGYRKQLAQPYLTDKSVNESLIKEAYERSKWEVNASHILVLVDENALPKDTLAAWNKMVDLRKKVMGGEPFDTVARRSSEDPSAKYNNGNLGFFTVFNLIYAFENFAYQTPKGEVSPIFRTRYGYHILKVMDKRPARPEIKVAHIMLKLPKDSVAAKQVKVRVDSLYQRALTGNFEELAKQYSEDDGTSRTGGVLNFITSIGGPWPTEFKEAAYSIYNIGGISRPVETQFGWHIVKLLERRELATFEQQKDQLKQRISRDQRSEVNKQAVLERIKKEYKFTETPKVLEQFYNKDSAALSKDLAAGKWQSRKEVDYSKVLFVLGPIKYTESDFVKYITDYQTPRQRGNAYGMVAGMYKDFVSQKCFDYEEKRLEEKYEDFRNLYQEYREGILLFDLMDKKVWSKAQTDTTGLKEFYESRKENYLWKDRVDAQIFECNDPKTAKLIKKLSKKNVSVDSILNVVNKSNPLNATGKQGKFEKGDQPVLDSLGWKQGINVYTDANGKSFVVHIREIIPSRPKKITEARGVITADYQNYLEKKWIAALRGKYPVVVQQDVKAALFNK